MPDPEEPSLPRMLYESGTCDIIELLASGGPSDDEFDRVPLYEKLVRETEENLTIAEITEPPESYARLVHALAVLSFLPGGVRIFTNNWETGGEEEDNDEVDPTI